ncbi:PH domain-containing protein [Dactylosporangium darangshiense]|uniref:YdbS-like PH domain-containing protein n=1 Tax=Dactylosporangium darangshiense TaxID=579108 RepID=A0ABP8D1P5_9ACTN
MNAPVAPDPLRPWPDNVQWRPVSPRYFLVRLAVLALWVLVVTVACVVTGVLWSAWFLLAAAAVLVAGAVRAVFLRRSIRSWGYAERAEDLLVRHGLLIRRLSIVPYARMQFVDVTAGPIERAAGLATVTLHTAAAASDATVPGLEAAEATRLRDRLSALGEIREEGL